ncbi:PRD domain-containing protein [Abyssisolibacter fermentans]|uniref:PRD domain-containing protein n=1 Tax=Abyssisolibacter fermentans TaxID=1766203 RepID=UPI000831EA25|nr:PRD domain-containing protein [Abyssisolibacter fermentans]
MVQFFKEISNKQVLLVESTNAINKNTKVLITSCITGIGTANKIKKLIENTFKDFLPQDFKIESKEYHLIDTQEKLLKQIKDDEEIVGIIGTFNINVFDIPFISLEELFSENGIDLLMDIIGIREQLNNFEGSLKEITDKFVSSITLQSIIDYLTILNPNRILSEVEEALTLISEKLRINISKQIRLRFLIHCCCMVERIIINKIPIEYEIKKYDNVIKEAFSVIKLSFSKIENNYGIELSNREIACIYELLYQKTP